MGKRIKEYENATQVALLGRKYQSVFVTSFVSEKGDNSKNNSYFSYIELDDFGCWLVVDGDNKGVFKEQIASYIGETIIESFIANPTIKRRELEKMLISIHKKYRNMQLKESKDSESYSSCSIAMVVTDYTKVNLLNIGNTRYGLLRNNVFMKKSCDDSLAYLQYEAGNILYDEIRFRKDKNILTQRFGIDRGIKIAVSESFQLKPKDKVLLCTQGAWENLADEDIEIISESSERVGKFVGTLVNQMKKNCFHKLNNYTICGIYIERPLIVPIIQKEKKGNLKVKKNNKLKKILSLLSVTVILSIGMLKYQKIRENNKIEVIEKEISFNLNQGDIKMKNENYSDAIVDFQKAKELYFQLKKMKSIPEDKLKDIESKIVDVSKIINANFLYEKGLKELEEDKYELSIKSFEEAKNILNNISLDTDFKENLIRELDISKKLYNAETEKIKADELYDNQNKSKNQRNAKYRKSVLLYKEILPIYKKYNRINRYTEISSRIEEYEKKIEKIKSVKLPTYEGDKKFNEYKYYSSLSFYEKSLKEAKTTEEKNYLKGKIEMNKQLLKAVELELKGDNLSKDEKNQNETRKYYEEALKENKKLTNNKYISKSRYEAIIKRINNKLKVLENNI